jgi:DNA repair protein RecO (recombination protein O)
MTVGFLLHSRPYRETSLLLSFFTDTDGRVDIIGRAARGSAKKRSSVPVLFSPYDVSWSGKSELKHLLHCESVQSVFQLTSKSLYCGLYVNELTYRLLPKHDAEPEFFQSYNDTLCGLMNAQALEPCLRMFELSLLKAIGYGLSLDRDCYGASVDPDSFYIYIPERGLQLSTAQEAQCCIGGLGEWFLAIDSGDYHELAVMQLAKKLLRAALSLYLGSRPLQSRELFR